MRLLCHRSLSLGAQLFGGHSAYLIYKISFFGLTVSAICWGALFVVLIFSCCISGVAAGQ